MPFSKKNPGEVIDMLPRGANSLARESRKRNRKSGKLSPKVSQEMRTWQKQCRMLSKKPIEEAVK